MLSNAREFLAMAEKQRATVPIMVGHRLMGISLFCTGDIQQGRAHFYRASASYDPAKHRALGTRFGVDTGYQSLHIGRKPFGCLVILRLHSRMPTMR